VEAKAAVLKTLKCKCRQGMRTFRAESSYRI